MTILTLTRIPAVLLVSGWSLLAPFLQPDAREGREGLRSYDRSQWSDAVDRFGRAREARPDGRYDFDLGTAAYRAGDFPAAANAFGAAARSADLPPGGSAFNLGNARFKAGDLEGALAAYRAALGSNPGDDDARFNYELALCASFRPRSSSRRTRTRGRRRIRSRSPSHRTRRARRRTPTPRRRSRVSSRSKRSSRSRTSRSRPRSRRLSRKPGERQRQPAEPERMLTPEQAAQLLDQVTPEERELLEARLKSARRRPAEKDW